MGDIVSAMKDYKHAIKLDPTHVLAHFNTGNVLFHQRLFKHALSSYDKAVFHCSEADDSILVNRAIVCSILRETDRAEEDFKRAIEVNQHSAHAYFNRGNLYKSIGEYEKALEDYEKGKSY